VIIAGVIIAGVIIHATISDALHQFRLSRSGNGLEQPQADQFTLQPAQADPAQHAPVLHHGGRHGAAADTARGADADVVRIIVLRAAPAQQTEKLARTRIAAAFAVADHENVAVRCAARP